VILLCAGRFQFSMIILYEGLMVCQLARIVCPPFSFPSISQSFFLVLWVFLPGAGFNKVIFLGVPGGFTCVGAFPTPDGCLLSAPPVFPFAGHAFFLPLRVTLVYKYSRARAAFLVRASSPPKPRRSSMSSFSIRCLDRRQFFPPLFSPPRLRRRALNAFFFARGGVGRVSRTFF